MSNEDDQEALNILDKHTWELYEQSGEQPIKTVMVPAEPPRALLISMAIRYDHGLGVPGYYDTLGNSEAHQQRLESTISIMSQLYEEVVGKGFYSDKNKKFYENLDL